MKRETGRMEEEKGLERKRRGLLLGKRERRKMHKREPAVPTLCR